MSRSGSVFFRNNTLDILKKGSADLYQFATSIIIDAKDKLATNQQTELSTLELNNDQEMIDALPPKSKPIDSLEFNDEMRATKKRKRLSGEVSEQDESYYFKKKKTEVDDGGAELEAYNAAICRFLVGSQYVVPVTAYYNRSGYVGHKSKFMHDFKTNYENPLHTTDTVIAAIRPSHLRSNIEGYARELYFHLKEKISLIDQISTHINHFFSKREMTDKLFYARLSNFLGAKEKFSTKELKSLITDIELYQQYLLNHHDRKNREKAEILESLVSQINQYASLERMDDELTLIELEEADEYAFAHKLNVNNADVIEIDGHTRKFKISGSDLIHYRTVKGLATTLTARYLLNEGDNNDSNFSKNGMIVDFGLTKYNLSFYLSHFNIIESAIKKPDQNTFKCTERDVRNFPILTDANLYYWPTKQLRASQIILRIIKEFIAKNMIFNSDNIMIKLIKNLTEETLSDIIEFKKNSSILFKLISHTHDIAITIKSWMKNEKFDETSLQDRNKEIADFLQYSIDKHVAQHADEIDRLDEAINKDLLIDGKSNRFSVDDIRTFKSLFPHPVFIFHKFKTILKYMLTDSHHYESIAEMYIAAKRKFTGESPYKGRYIREAVVTDESRRISEISSVVTEMDEFKEFLQQHGDFAFGLIKREFEQYQNEFTNKKSDSRPKYEQLVKSIDTDKMTEKYKTITSPYHSMNPMFF